MMEHHSTIKLEGGLLIHTCLNLKIMIVTERSQTRKSAFYMIPFVLNSRKCKLTYNNRKQISVCLGMDKGLERGITSRQKVTFEGDRYVHYLDCKMVSWQFHRCIHLFNSSNDILYICAVYYKSTHLNKATEKFENVVPLTLML